MVVVVEHLAAKYSCVVLHVTLPARKTHTETASTYTMFALYQCGFSPASGDKIPVPVNPANGDQIDFFMSHTGLCKPRTCLTSFLKHGQLTYLFLFGATLMSSLVGVYFGTWNHSSLCCGSTSPLKIMETNIRRSHHAQQRESLVGPQMLERYEDGKELICFSRVK